MFRTIKLELPDDSSLLETGRQFREACQMVLDYGFAEKTYNKNKLNRATYEDARKKIPALPSALVQTARDKASESLKQTDLEKEIRMKSLAIRYDGRTFRLYPDTHTISLTSVHGRIVFPIAYSPLKQKYRGEYTDAQVAVDAKQRKMFVTVQVELPNKEAGRKANGEIKVVGIDRGIKNIPVLSNNSFFNSKALKSVNGRYRYDRKKLLHAGTRPAHRKLRESSGREIRFVLGTHHVISKQIANAPFDVFALEDLEYTSQKRSKCGYVERNNRKGSKSHCRNCNFQLHADLNASRNIGVIGKSEYFRLLSTSQSLRFGESMPTGMVEAGSKPLPSGMGS
ncbi:MAG: zinc ribbon domain-containing protein [Candidatus Thermoplasmatota archaeon]|nr:zinc ribbon domain-containing protein [Candidatus Thermoplasmatota archaeon]